MLYLLLTSLVFLLLFTFIILDRDIFAPAFIVVAVFFVSTVGCIINAKYWKTELDVTTIGVVFGGCFVFMIVAAFCNGLCQNVYGRQFSKELIKLEVIKTEKWKIIFILLMNLVLIYLQIRFINRVVSLSSSGNLVTWGLKMEYYRNVVSYDSSNLHISVPAYVNALNKLSTIFAYVFVYVNVNNFLAQKDQKLKKRFDLLNIAPIAVYILFNLICATRGSIIQIFVSVLIIYHLLYHKQNGWSKRYNFKALFKIVALLVVLLVIFVSLRDVVGRNYSETARNPLYYICCYVGGPIHLLDDFIKNPPEKSSIWGKETFYSIIRFLGQRLGISDWIYVSHLEFRYSNGLNVGNVYTAFRKYIYDFGYLGVVWCTALVSLVYNSIYYSIRYKRKKRKQFDIGIMFFGYISYGYFYMSIQEQPLSTILCTTTLIMPVLYIIAICFFKLKLKIFGRR